jgi:hypothetical protein
MKAMLIGINWETGDVKHQEVISIKQGNGLRRSIESDFPGYEWAVFGDREARELQAHEVVREFEEDERHNNYEGR